MTETRALTAFGWLAGLITGLGAAGPDWPWLTAGLVATAAVAAVVWACEQ